MRIHKEGFFILGSSLLLMVVFVIILWMWLASLGLILGFAIAVPIYAFLLRFFRVPKRIISPNSNTIFSPADGKVVAFEVVDEPEYLKTRCMQVSVFMSVWNVHVNWFPFSGKVAYYRYHPGKFLVAWHPKSSTENERTTVVIERNDGVKVLFRQIAGLVARRIICYAKEGEAVSQFQEMGFIKFGSRVDLFLPLDAEIKVALNQKVTGNITEIASIPMRE